MGTPKKIAGALQENVLAMLCFHDGHCNVVRTTIDLKLYSNPIFRTIAGKAYDFIDAHGEAPKDHLPDLLEEYINESKEGHLYSEMVHGLFMLARSLNVKYTLNQLGLFVSEHALRLGIVEAADALQNEDLDGARSCIETALRKTAPVFEPGTTLLNTVDRIRSGALTRDVMPCGIPHLDKLELGPARGELWMLIGGPKRGKSWSLINVSRAAILARLKVLYVTLEVSQEIISQRIIQAITGYYGRPPEDDQGQPVRNTYIPRVVMRERRDKEKSGISHVEQISVKRHPHLLPARGDTTIKAAPGLLKAEERIKRLHVNDRLRIKSFPTGMLAVRELITYLDQMERMENFVPDILVLDYADLIDIDRDNYRIALGNTMKQIRGIAVDRNIAIATASQLNRPGAGQQFATELHVAEDFSKIAIADTVLVMNQLLQEKDQGLARLYVAAARNERDKFSVLITQNYEIGQFCLASCREPGNYRTYLRQLVTGDGLLDDAPDVSDVEDETEQARANGHAVEDETRAA